MKKALFSALLMLVVSLTAMAVPAKRGQWRALTLQDGTTVQAMLVGDEFGHFFVDANGKTYQESSTANVYVTADAEKIKKQAQVRRARANAQRAKRLAPQKIGSVGHYTGQKRCPVILVNFQDTKFKTANNNALYQRIANEVNFSYGDFVGSMYDYFYAQSDGQFELNFDVVGPYLVNNSASYYGGNDSDGNDQHPAEMIIEAVKAANNDLNYANYDWDNDGYVDQVYIIYAGKGEADGGAASTIWPHAYDLRSAAYYGDGSGVVTLDGVKINSYACGGELNGSGNICGIGTMCHEFSHCLGYPDFYDIDYSGGWGMDEWDLMSGGSYNGNGYVPCGYTSYERGAAGWRTPIELTSTQNVTGMKALENQGDSYVIYNDGNRNEYFLLENRQKTGWDSALSGEGLLIVHVDYNATVWNNNEPNDDPNHQRMTWIPADNQLQTDTYQGYTYLTAAGLSTDPYPTSTNNVFSNTSTPAATLYNKNTDNTYYLNKSVENITQNADGSISFRFRGTSSTKAPAFTPAPGRYTSAQTVTITSETSGADIFYTIDGTDPTTSSTLYVAPIVIDANTTLKAIAVKDGEESSITSGVYRFGSASDSFVKVTDDNQIVVGQEYIFVSPDYDVAAGAKHDSGNYLTSVEAVISDDTATSTEALVFTLGGSAGAYSFQCDDGYLSSSAAKNVTLSNSESTMWSVSVSSSGATISGSSVGTFQYNSSSPRFTTYTSTQKPAYLYVRGAATTQTVATPVFSPGEGTYTSSQTVTITCETEGASIYYTLDESDPTTASTLYTGPVFIDKDEEVVELRAIAVKEGMADSEIASAVYLFEEAVDVATPTFNYESGEYATDLTDVQITCATEGATIYYTTNGSTPTNESTQYTGNITVSQTTTIKAIAYVNTSASDVAAITLTIARESGGNGTQLLYESFSGKTDATEESTAASTTNSALDYSGWSAFTKVFLSGTAPYDNGGCAKLGSSKATGSMTANSIPLTGAGTLTFYLKKYVSDTGKLNVTVTGATADVTQFTPSDTWTKCTVNLTGGTGSVSITLETSSKRAYVDEIVLTEAKAEEPIEQTIGVTGYSTMYYSDKILIVPEGVEATTWYVEDGELKKGRTYKAGQKIPAGEAVVLFDNSNVSSVYEFAVASSCSDTPDARNMLHGFDTEGTTTGDAGASYKFYKFSFKGRDATGAPTNIGFYYGATDGAAFTSAAHKAYLAVPESAMSAGIKAAFLFPQAGDDNATGINSMHNEECIMHNSPSGVYDLQGRKVIDNGQLKPGIYIVNGKKIVIR